MTADTRRDAPFNAQLSPLEAQVLDLACAADFAGYHPSAATLCEACQCTSEELFAALVSLREKHCICWTESEGRIALAPLHS